MTSDADASLAGGSYEVLRARLAATAGTLEELAAQVNAARKAEFGGQDLAVLATERLRTHHSCVARDVAALGHTLLAGFNVFLGLKQERSVADVFFLAELGSGEPAFTEQPPSAAGGFLEDRRFVKDLEDLFRFYKDARLARLERTDTRLFAVFQTGLTARDVKVLRFTVDASGRATYLDNRGDEELPRPQVHDFGWTRAGRERFVPGRHPHVNILDEVFIETVGGDLTVKIEDNTEDGQGIYREPVEEKSQSLDDAEFHFARVGALILLKVLPYRESAYRYLVFNTNTEQVVRADGVGRSCVALPEEQGVIFPGGYVLQTGEVKLLDGAVDTLELKRIIASPNGEDMLYVFSDAADGAVQLLAYNQVRKEVASPITGQGFTIFPDGRLVVLKGTAEPTRVHPVQVWLTPFMSAEFAAAAPTSRTALGRLGNAELVKGISEVLSLVRLARAGSPTRKSFEALSASCTRVLDQFHWLGQAEVGLKGRIEELKGIAVLIIDEFEKVVALRRRAAEALGHAREAHAALLARSATADGLPSIDAYMDALAGLRRHRGALVTLRETRYIDVAALEAMDGEAAGAFDEVSRWCVRFLLTPAAFRPVHEGIDQVDRQVGAVTRTVELAPLLADVERLSEGLGLLGEIVGGLGAGDPVEKATILDAVSEAFARLNRTRAQALGKKRDLTGAEKRAEFTSQFRLLAQSVDAALSRANTPEVCDEQQARLLVQLEDLEGRFADFDEFATELAQRREDLLTAFAARKQALVDERQRRAAHLFEAADRILRTVARRAEGFSSDDELNTYFGADPLVQKVGSLVAQLVELKDTVKAEELEARLKTARQDALRTLRDRQELFEGGAQIVKLGTHRFTVNTQPLEPTIIPRDGSLFLHLSGSDFFEALSDPDIDAARDLWDQTRPSESKEVYRGEFLAQLVVDAAEAGAEGLSPGALRDAAREGALQPIAARVGATRYDDGYERGVHDADAAVILAALLKLREGAGRLRFPATARVLGTLFFASWADEPARAAWTRRAASLARLTRRYPSSRAVDEAASELAPALAAFAAHHGLDGSAGTVALAARALVEELGTTPLRFVVSEAAVRLKDELLAELDRASERAAFEDELAASGSDLVSRWRLARQWLSARAGGAAGALLAEAALALVLPELPRDVSAAALELSVHGLLGQHPRIAGGAMTVALDDFLTRLTAFRHERLPRYARFRARVHGVLHATRQRLRLDELKPRVLSTFVRNRLIDEVYLPLIGTNLAKQLGAAGETKRTDRMGLLLLVSPPGYGKTTLMEYVAARLGLTFVKVNGPALGHAVTTLDPAEAPDATSRQELERINLGFELGNNVMLYLDDIQHTSAELLQKFISLCDATRKVEGVWNGRSRTYDLRGKRFCVVMAGNPYTESGERFRIPDMLANRADTYNLGDMAAGQEDLFASSYIENALTSNPITAPLLARAPSDLHRLIAMARGGETSATELAHPYTAAELNDVVQLIRHLLYVQRTLAVVNHSYIRSASQDDRFRTEPPFKLQGSYRNMNKLAEKLAPAMSHAELEALIDAHYQSESQTLTSAAEANLLKLAELRERMSPAQRARWEELKRGFKRVQVQGGAEDDPVVRVTGSIAALGEELSQLNAAVTHAAARPEPAHALTRELGAIAAALAAPREEVKDLGRLLAEALARPRDGNGAAVSVSTPERTAAELLAPVLERLSAVLDASLARPAAPSAVDLGPLMERLATVQPPAAVEGEGTLREEMAHQLLLIQERLHELAAAARASLQVDPDGSLKAMTVWQQAREAIELLKALPSRGRRRT